MEYHRITISELIEKLEKIKKKHGEDVFITVEPDDRYYDFHSAYEVRYIVWDEDKEPIKTVFLSTASSTIKQLNTMENENKFIKSMTTALNFLSKEVFSDTEKHFTFCGVSKTSEALMCNLFSKGLREAGFTVWRDFVSNEIKITKG